MYFIQLSLIKNQNIHIFVLFQEAALRTFHINDDSTKYCITVPTDDGMKIIK
jgi:hypothetical protein